MPPRSKRKRDPQPEAPPLEWLRQSVWAGEELPEELELLETTEPAPAKHVRKAPARTSAKPKKKV